MGEATLAKRMMHMVQQEREEVYSTDTCIPCTSVLSWMLYIPSQEQRCPTGTELIGKHSVLI